MVKSRSSLLTFHWPRWVTWSHLSETGCGKSSPTIFLRRENWTCVSSLDDCCTWSKKASDDKETLRQKTQESKEWAGRYCGWGTSSFWVLRPKSLESSWLFPLPFTAHIKPISKSHQLYLQTISRVECCSLPAVLVQASASLSCLVFFFFFLTVGLHCQACGILVAWPRIKPVFPALAMWRLNQWTTREVPSPLDYCRSLSPALTAVCSPHSNQRGTFQIEVRAWRSFAQILLLFPIFLGVKALYPLQSLTPSTPHPPSSTLPSLCPPPQLFLSRSLHSNNTGLCDLSPVCSIMIWVPALF